MHWFQGLSQADIERLGLRTFAHTFVQSGDILFVPSGSILCEKAVSKHNVILRVPSTFLSRTTTSSCCLVAGACGVQTLVMNKFSFLFCLFWASGILVVTVFTVVVIVCLFKFMLLPVM